MPLPTPQTLHREPDTMCPAQPASLLRTPTKLPHSRAAQHSLADPSPSILCLTGRQTGQAQKIENRKSTKSAFVGGTPAEGSPGPCSWSAEASWGLQASFTMRCSSVASTSRLSEMGSTRACRLSSSLLTSSLSCRCALVMCMHACRFSSSLLTSSLQHAGRGEQAVAAQLHGLLMEKSASGSGVVHLPGLNHWKQLNIVQMSAVELRGQQILGYRHLEALSEPAVDSQGTEEGRYLGWQLAHSLVYALVGWHGCRQLPHRGAEASNSTLATGSSFRMSVPARARMVIGKACMGVEKAAIGSHGGV